MNPHDYSITVRRVMEDGEACFEARVRELPDVVEYADSVAEAYDLALDTIRVTSEVFAEQGKSMPNPVPVRPECSGRITLRVPKTLHQSLVLGAEDEGISLNQYLVTALSYFAGVQTSVRALETGPKLKVVRDTPSTASDGWREVV